MNSATGTEISTGQAILLMIQAYDSYMIHNEQAHCCLDNRIACTDKGVWGGVDCPADPQPECESAIVTVLQRHYNYMLGIVAEINSIKYTPGPKHRNAMLPRDPKLQCGPC